MRFLRAHIFGYGKFVGFEMEFYPGFQIVYGPNESGKTTLLNFILDMIFGQKTSIRKGAQLSENYYIYKPWNESEYKGELCIRLDNQNLIHLRRIFGDNGSLLVFEGVNPTDITSRYPQLPNAEVAFPQSQFGISRDLFVSIATISMKTLDQLGGPDCIKRIKEHLVRLIDTGSLEASSKEIIEYLGKDKDGYLQRLLSLRDSLKDKKENLSILKEEQLNLRGEYIACKKQYMYLIREIGVLQNEVENLRERVTYSNKYRLWRKKNDAKALVEQLDGLTAQYFSYSSVKDFPLQLNTRLVQLKSAYEHLVRQKESIQRKLDEITLEIDNLEEELRVKKFKKIDDIHYLREKFNRLNDNILKMESPLEEKKRLRDKLRSELAEIERKKNLYPGMDKISQEVIDKFDGLNNLHNTLLMQIENEEEKLRRTENELEQLKYELHPLIKTFGEYRDISGLVLEYEYLTTEPEKIVNRLQLEINKLEDLIESYKEEKRTHLVVGVICFLLSLFFGYFYFITYSFASVFFALVIFLAMLYCMGTYRGLSIELKEKENLLEGRGKELERVRSEPNISSHPVAKMMASAGVATISELLGLHRRYLMLLDEKEELEKRIYEIGNDIDKYRNTKDAVFLRMVEEVSIFGLELKDESEIQKVRQELIRLKDRAKDFVNKAHDLNAQISDLENEMKVDERNLRELKANLQQEVYEKVLPLFVEMGLVKPETPITSDSFINYFNLQKEVEELRKRVMEKRKERENLYNELQHIESSINSTYEEIQEIFDIGGVKDFAEWDTKYKQAKKAKDIYEGIEKTKRELDYVLGDYTIDKIEEMLGDFVPGGEPDNLEEIEKVFLEKQSRFEELRKKLEHLNLRIAELVSKMKDLVEIEEEIEGINLKLSQIDDEEEAVNYAITTLTRVSQDKDSQVLVKLEEEISSLFSKITHQKYSAVKLERDLSPLVYSPERQKYLPLEELNLSQGTVDQLYFSIRIAILRTMCANGEKLPMILDEPFLNYDTERLTNAVQTLNELGKDYQIILLTCKDDIVSLAEILGIPVLKIKPDSD